MIFITLFSSLSNTHEFQRIETRVKIKENGSSTSITVSQTEGRKTDKSVDELHNKETRSVIRDIVKISLSLQQSVNVPFSYRRALLFFCLTLSLYRRSNQRDGMNYVQEGRSSDHEEEQRLADCRGGDRSFH